MRKINLIIIDSSGSDRKGDKTKDGYHYHVRKDGFVKNYIGISAIGSHCKGKNTNSIGICLDGNRMFTDFQFKALAELIKGIMIRLGYKLLVELHSKYSDTDGPRFSMKDFKRNYL